MGAYKADYDAVWEWAERSEFLTPAKFLFCNRSFLADLRIDGDRYGTEDHVGFLLGASGVTDVHPRA